MRDMQWLRWMLCMKAGSALVALGHAIVRFGYAGIARTEGETEPAD